MIRRLVALSSTTSSVRPCNAGGNAACQGRGFDPTASGTIVKWNVEPLPTSLSTHMRPPISSASSLLMASPRPVPP